MKPDQVVGNLKDCPFCGSKAIYREAPDDDGMDMVTCENKECPAQFMEMPDDSSKQKLFKDWNRRALSDSEALEVVDAIQVVKMVRERFWTNGEYGNGGRVACDEILSTLEDGQKIGQPSGGEPEREIPKKVSAKDAKIKVLEEKLNAYREYVISLGDLVKEIDAIGRQK